jgi:hypothetical protein
VSSEARVVAAPPPSLYVTERSEVSVIAAAAGASEP